MVNSIGLGDIKVLAGLKNPPPDVKEVMSAVLILLGEKKTDWANAAPYLKEPKKFKRILIQFDK